MLVLTRRRGESLRIGPDIRVTVVSASSGHVRIAIDAPEDVRVYREEIHDRVASANRSAAEDSAAVIEAIGSAAIATPAEEGRLA